MLRVYQRAEIWSTEPSSNPFHDLNSTLIAHVTGIKCGFGFQHEYMSFTLGNGFVLHATRNDQEFPFIENDFLIAEQDFQLSFQDHEQFIFGFMVMPDEFTMQFSEFYVLLVEFSHNFWAPVHINQAHFLGKSYFFHLWMLPRMHQ